MTEPNTSTGKSTGAGNAPLLMIKSVHTVAWLSIESCVVYLVYAGLRGRSDRRAAIAGCVVAGETLLFAANGFRSPDPIRRAGRRRVGVGHRHLPPAVVRAQPPRPPGPRSHRRCGAALAQPTNRAPEIRAAPMRIISVKAGCPRPPCAPTAHVTARHAPQPRRRNERWGSTPSVCFTRSRW